MHQTRKGSEWHFGMKIHIGVDDTLGLIHSIDTTAANVHDIVPTYKLLHGEEQRVFDDAGYLGIQKRGEHKHREDVSWFIAKRPCTRQQLDSDKLKAEKIKASVRGKVEHPFRYIKQVFGYDQVRHRGFAKNNNRLHLLAAFSNLLIGENTCWRSASVPEFRQTGKKLTNNGEIISEIPNLCRFRTTWAKIAGYSDLPKKMSINYNVTEGKFLMVICRPVNCIRAML